MPDPTDFEQFPVFGDNSSKVQPGDQKYAAGFLLGDVLPAEWLNWFLNTGTKGYNELVDAVCDPDVEGKTIDSADNTVLCTPTLISASTTLNCTKEMYVIVDTADVTITLGTAPYNGYALTIMSAANNSCRVQYTYNTTITDVIWGVQPTTYIYLGSGTWRIAEGSTLRTFSSAAGINDWKTYRGNGTYSFGYSASGAATAYDLPYSYGTLTITWISATTATVTYVDGRHSAGNENYPVDVWYRNFNNGTWSAWTHVIGKGEGTLHTETSLASGITGTVYWVVQNGICMLTTAVTASATGNNKTIITTAPTAKMTTWQATYANRGGVHITAGSSTLQINVTTASQTQYCTIAYPVADDWVES